MRLATLETDLGDRAVAVSGDASHENYVDLQAVDPNLPGSIKAILALDDGVARAADALAKGETAGTFVAGNLRAPIPDPGKVVCIGLNYRDHAEESNMPIPTEPICFSKFSSAIVGPEDTVQLPAAAREVDYEAELVAVIGRTAKNVSKADALDYVAGYCNGNDVSARDWQIGRPGGQWLLGKTPDTFAPIGPYLVTSDEVADSRALSIALRLNGETMQDSSTKELIFGVDEIVAHISQLFTLQPGDVIFTGTPPGVGMARKPPVWIKNGDVMEVEIAGLGVLRNPVVG